MLCDFSVIPDLPWWWPVQFSRSVLSDSLQPHGLQHARLPCPSLTLGACSHLMSIKSVMPSNHLIFWPSLLLLPSILPSIRVFSNESILRTGWWPVLFKRSLIWAYWNQPPALIFLMPFIPTHFCFLLLLLVTFMILKVPRPLRASRSYSVVLTLSFQLILFT